MTAKQSTPTIRRPNILWFSLEDTSPRFGCYGTATARTPHIDRIAAEGCLYENAFAIAPVCAPARNGIITARYATANGAQHMRTAHESPGEPAAPMPYECVPPPHVKAFTETLRAAGYFCCNNDKTDYQFGRPPSIWDRCDKDAHWRQREEGQPFFAVFNPMWTHESGQWPKEDEKLVTDPETLELPPFLPDTPEVRQTLARQDDHIAMADALLGKLLSELEEDGLAEETIIFIWSDHGMGLPRFKRWPYDTGLRVPLIVRAPGLLEPGTRSAELISTIDLGPTVLGLAGLDRPVSFHGRNFLGPDRDAPREVVFGARDRYDENYDKMRTVRDHRYRLVRNFYPNLEREFHIPYRNRHPAMAEIWQRAAAGTLEGAQQWFVPGPRRPEELYDTKTDPWELENRIDDPDLRDVRDRLRRELEEYGRLFDPWFDVPETEMVRQWYPNGQQPKTAAPAAVAHGPGQTGTDLLPAAADVRAPCLIQLVCGSEGASIEWRLESDPADRWRLYTGSLRLPPGDHVLHARGVRYGYAVSSVTTWQLSVVAGG
jgi:N-sulfoglucosamine sulfohydrolase